MPDPPYVSVVTRYVLENPYPLGVAILALALALAWTTLRSGRRRSFAAAGALAALGAVILVIGALVVTSGEHAERVTRALVGAAVEADVTGMLALFADDAAISLGSPNNPAYARPGLEQRIAHLDGKYRVSENTITMLDAYTELPRRATVHLGCRTMLDRGYAPTSTQWVLVIERGDDGEWKITHVTWISMAGRAPGSDTGL